MKKEIVFEIDSKKILNSNSLPNHYFVKGQIVSYLRKLGQDTGLQFIPREHYNAALKILDQKNEEENTKKQKSRLTKKLKKENKLSEKEIAKEIEETFPKTKNEQGIIPYLFDKFKITVMVCPPTRRRIDPANLWPTVKPLIDGLTDVSFWEDDDFNHLIYTSFLYGKPTGISKLFKIIFIIEELTEKEIKELEKFTEGL